MVAPAVESPIVVLPAGPRKDIHVDPNVLRQQEGRGRPLTVMTAGQRIIRAQRVTFEAGELVCTHCSAWIITHGEVTIERWGAELPVSKIPGG